MHAFSVVNKEWHVFHFTKPVDSSVWTDTARKGLKIVLSVGDTFVYQQLDNGMGKRL